MKTITCTIFILSLVTFLFGCAKERDAVNIGFIGTLTGEYSNAGIMARNGFLLAVEETQMLDPNYRDRKINVHILDDQFKTEGLTSRVRNFIVQNKIEAVVGPLMSSVAISIKELFPPENGVNIPFVSPTIATSLLSGIDDYFFTLNQNTIALAKQMIAYLREHSKASDDIGIIYDTANSGYAADLMSQVERQLKLQKVQSIKRFEFNGVTESLEGLVEKLKRHRPAVLLIISNSYHTALLMQQFSKFKYQPQVLITQWTIEEEFLAMAGDAAEGAIGFIQFNLERDHLLTKFRNNYRNRFGVYPTYISLYSYEAAKLLLNIQNGDDKELTKKITGRIKGTYLDLEMDRFGDGQREKRVFRVKKGQWVEEHEE